MNKLFFLLSTVFLTSAALSQVPPAQDWETIKMNKISADESHCLVLPEIRTENDNRISCYCRDALMDGRYVYHKYFAAGKDDNLSGVVLALEAHAKDVCGQDYDVVAAIDRSDWRWDGPEVTRKYPPDSEIRKIEPIDKGFRRVRYEVQLTFHDKQGRVLKIENFAAVELFPPNWK